MSTTHALRFTRFNRQVRTEPMGMLSTPAAAAHAAWLLERAEWVQGDVQQATMPARRAKLSDGAASLAYDAYKYVGDYDQDTGRQRAYAGMAAYRFQVPADALAATAADVVSIAAMIHVDRWLVDGVRLAVYLSDDPVPSADWGTLRQGDAYSDALLPMLYTAEDERIVIDKSSLEQIALPASSESKKYLYLIVSLEDYTTTGGTYATGADPDRSFWIEGAALIEGESASVEFSRSVTADPAPWQPDVSSNTSTTGVQRHIITGPANSYSIGVHNGYTYTYLAANPQHAQAVWDSVIGNHQIDTYDSNSGFGIAGLSGEDSDDSTDRPFAKLRCAVSYRNFHPTRSGQKRSLVFVPHPPDAATASIDAPPANIVCRIVCYYLPGAVFESTATVGFSAARVVAETAAARRAFWEGTSTSISKWYSDAATVYDAVPLLALDVSQSYPLGHAFPINANITGDGVIIIGQTVSRVTGTIPFAGTTDKLWDWLPWNVEVRA